MGFLNSCWEALLQLTTYSHMLDGHHGYNSQQPLNIPGHQIGIHADSSTGPTFTVAGTNFTCSYPDMKNYRACNSASDRSCWLRPRSRSDDLFDIHTEYDTPDDSFTPKGVIREYWLEVSVEPIAPDGYLKPLAQLFNKTYPGPHLEGCWGDQFVVHVTNKIPNLGTTIHWHGIRMLNNNPHDGVNGVTQCPIAFNQTFTYNFTAEQYGHTWYHSHYQTQYSDGVAGPLTIYGPSSSNWDEAFEPIMMQDWVHDNTSVAFQQELAGLPPVADGLLLGGHNQFRCSNLDPRCCANCHAASCDVAAGEDCRFSCNRTAGCYTDGVPSGATLKQGSIFNRTMEEGKRYLLQLINASADAMFIFAIDDHDLEVIAADLVPIEPYVTSSIFVAIGQRYQVIVTAKPNKKTEACKADSLQCNYWIRTRIASGCGSVAQIDEETGIIRYNDESFTQKITPTTIATDDREECKDEPADKLQPVVPWNIRNVKNRLKSYTFEAAIDDQVNHGAFRWELAEKPLFLNYSNPSILNVGNTAYWDNKSMAPVRYTNATWNDGYVYLMITANNTFNTPGKTRVPAAHPIHLHGHDFAILAQVDQWDGRLPKLNYNNPPRRDTALLYRTGILVLAFKLDNPGIWLVHCHIAWHASSGLALQIIEREDEIVGSIGDLAPTRDTCEGWRDMNLQFEQEDSGI